MYLFLKDDYRSPRTLILCTSTDDERSGTPSRALVFRTAETDSTKVTVEFLHLRDVDLNSAVRLTTRRVKGCLGLINVGEGLSLNHTLSNYLNPEILSEIIVVGRYFSGSHIICY